MANPGPPDLNRAAIEEAAQRTAEQAALRKVRKKLDSLEAEETRRRRTVRRIALVGIIAIVCVVVVVWIMLSANREQLRGAPIAVPGTLKK